MFQINFGLIEKIVSCLSLACFHDINREQVIAIVIKEEIFLLFREKHMNKVN